MKSYCYLGHKIGIDIFEKGFNDIDLKKTKDFITFPHTYNGFVAVNFLTSKKWRPPQWSAEKHLHP